MIASKKKKEKKGHVTNCQRQNSIERFQSSGVVDAGLRAHDLNKWDKELL